MEDSNPHNIQRLAQLLKGIDIAMLTTTEPDRTLRSRPMATQQHDFNGQLWFFTDKNSHKVSEIAADDHVNLSYIHPTASRFISVSGTARLVIDPEKAEQLWFPLLDAWFPKGPSDPDLALLNVTPIHAEFWDSPASGVIEVLTFVQPILTAQHARTAQHEIPNLH